MEALDVLRSVMEEAGKGGYELSRDMGRAPSYVGAALGRGSVPKADTLAAMLAPCGYVLAAVPADDVPAAALVIDAPAPPCA